MTKPDLEELRRLMTVYPGETAEPWQLALLASKAVNALPWLLAAAEAYEQALGHGITLPTLANYNEDYQDGFARGVNSVQRCLRTELENALEAANEQG